MLCKADGQVTADEIQRVRTIFGVDSTALPNAAEVFAEGVRSHERPAKFASEIKEMLNGNEGPLRAIVGGLMEVATADGSLDRLPDVSSG